MATTLRETLELNGLWTKEDAETNDVWTKEEAKVLEIMEHLIANVKDSYIKPDYNWGEYELTTFGRKDNKLNFVFGKDGKEYPARTSDDEWTLVEHFVRQYLNNGSDGFGMVNVEECFDYIMDNIDFIIEQDMISEKGWNKSGQELWSNYRPEHPMVFNY